jgi:hypothetical protein
MVSRHVDCGRPQRWGRVRPEQYDLSVRRVGYDCAHEHHDRYDRVLLLAGPLDDEQRARILLMADQCPVGKTLGRGADIITTLSPVGSQDVSPAATEYLNDLEAVAAIEDPWIAPP